jgi:hypothetical protein
MVNYFMIKLSYYIVFLDLVRKGNRINQYNKCHFCHFLTILNEAE